MIALLLSTAQAVEPAVYAQRATLELPAEGAAMIDLGDITAVEDDLLLLDAEGRIVPTLVLDSQHAQVRRSGETIWEPRWDGRPPHASTIEIDTRSLGHPIDELWLSLSGLGSEWAVDLEVRDGRGRLVGEGSLWQARLAGEQRSNRTISFEEELLPGTYTVHAPYPLDWQRVSGWWSADSGVGPYELELPVEGPTWERAQESVYRFDLPLGGLDATELRLEVEDARFDREVQVWTRRFDGEYLREHHVGSGRIERLQLGGADIEHLVLDLEGELGSELEVRITDGRDEALRVVGAELEAVGRQLLVYGAGPGPHQLYAEPARRQPGGHDLNHALVELLDEGPPRIAAAWMANPDHNPAEVVPDALRSGAVAQVRHHPLRRALEAPEAGVPTRWWLPQEVVTSARGDLGDLRIVDAEGQQVPYLLDSGRLLPIGTTVVREEDGPRTRLRVTLDEPSYVDHIELSTSSRAFSRRVSVVHGRSTGWTTLPEDGAARLSIDVKYERSEIEIWIANGDDRALEDLEVRAWSKGGALVAVAPEGGATLFYGDPETHRPDYDLRLYGALLTRGVVREGSLGPPEGHSVSTPGDRRLATGAIAALALGLVFVSARLLRAE